MSRQWWHGWRQPKDGRWMVDWAPFRAPIADIPWWRRWAADFLWWLAQLTLRKFLYLVRGPALAATMLQAMPTQSPDATGLMFGAGGVYTNTVYGPAFPGATLEAQYTNAVAAAKSMGLPFCLVLNKPYNANNVTFDGTVRMIREGGNPQTFDLKAYGAAGNSTDDTAAIAGALAGAMYASSNGTLGGIVWVPSAQTYVHSGTFSITSGVTIRGEGKFKSVIRTSSATVDQFSVTTTDAVDFSDLTLGSTVARTAGASITIAPAASYNTDSVFRRINFSASATGIDFEAAARWQIEDCYFASYVNNGLIVKNTAVPDSGDSSIYNCVFDGGAGTGVGVNQFSSGGLRVENCKFLNGAYHYIGQFNATTSALLFVGNSCEGASASTMSFNASAAATFGGIVITGNQFSVSAGGLTGIVFQDPGYVAFDGAIIGNNTFKLANNATAISATRGDRFTFAPNTVLGNGASTVGIVFAATLTRSYCMIQNMPNVTTPFSGVASGVTFEIADTVSADRGDASIVLTAKVDAPIQIFNSPLTAGRTVTLPTGGSRSNGDKFRIVRTAGATGASTLTVQTLLNGNRALAVGQEMEAHFDGTNWIETLGSALL